MRKYFKTLYIGVTIVFLLFCTILTVSSTDNVISLNNDELSLNISSVDGDFPQYVINLRQRTLLYYEYNYQTLKINILQKNNKEYKTNYENYEWYIEALGNNEYVIYNDNEKKQVLTYSQSGDEYILTIENLTSGVQNKHKWIFIQEDDDHSDYYRITNYDNGMAIFAYDNGDLGLVASNYTRYMDAQLWYFGTSDGANTKWLTNFSANNFIWLSDNPNDETSTHTLKINSTPYKALFSQENSEYSFSISDTSIAVITNDGVITAQSMGTTVLKIVHENSGITHRIPITVGQIVANGSYYITNRESGKNIDVDNQIPICERNLNANYNQMWTIKYEGEGYYSIKSNDNKYLAVRSPYFIVGIGIELSESLTDGALWKITSSTQGGYKLSTKGSEGLSYSLVVNGSGGENTYLKQLVYIDDVTYFDEWYIQSISGNSVYTGNIGLNNNTYYYIKNINSGRYMKLEKNSNGSISVATSFSCLSNLSYWYFDQFTLNSNTSKIFNLGIDSKYALENNSNTLILSSNHSAFTLKRVNVRPYDGTYVITSGNYYLYENMMTGEVLLSTNLTPSCFWSISRVDKGNAYLFNFTSFFPYAGDTYDKISEYLTDCSFSFDTLTDSNAQTAYGLLENCDIFIFRGHGAPGLISFDETSLYSYETNVDGNYSLSSYSNNGLSKLRMAFFLGCSTGDKPLNYERLQKVAYEKGAHFAIGTLDTVYTDHGNLFILEVLNALTDGYSLKDAIDLAQDAFANVDVYLPSYNITVHRYPIIYVGDVYQTIN